MPYLTRRQKEILDFLREFHARHGFAPTHREIRERFGYSSYGTVHKHLKLLEGKGFLHRHWNQKRGVVLDEERGGRALTEVPFFGRIAAGRPLEPVPDREAVTVPEHLLGGRTAAHYVLQVAGESMIDEGIHDGDWIVVERREQAEAGEMVVALVDGEATLKRFYPQGDVVRLQPANPQMEPIRVAADRVRVQGVVVGLMRRF